jgi:hypothetical protein
MHRTHQLDWGFVEPLDIVSGGRLSWISGRTLTGLAALGGMAGILGDPAHFEYIIESDENDSKTHFLRMLSNHEHEWKVVHPECGIKETIGVDEKYNIFHRIFHQVWFAFYSLKDKPVKTWNDGWWRMTNLSTATAALDQLRDQAVSWPCTPLISNSHIWLYLSFLVQAELCRIVLRWLGVVAYFV